MIRTTRVSPRTMQTLAVACLLGTAACGGSNDPATSNGGAGGATSDTTTTSTSSSTTGSTSATTSSSTTGSTSATTSSSTTGSSSTSSGTLGMPACAGETTAAGPAPTKGGACTAADPQFCYKECGPEDIGFKSETCMSGAYVEQSGCTFPSGMDYSCYKIPTTISATCPTTIPQASTACDVAPCTLCDVGGQYLDSTSTMKTGYCVCPAGTATAPSKWSCASTTAWPCPAGQGC